jgi:hypothetical protein
MKRLSNLSTPRKKKFCKEKRIIFDEHLNSGKRQNFSVGVGARILFFPERKIEPTLNC